jgi:hypothetical protein
MGARLFLLRAAFNELAKASVVQAKELLTLLFDMGDSSCLMLLASAFEGIERRGSRKGIFMSALTQG